jgi:hypothetical protein
MILLCVHVLQQVNDHIIVMTINITIYYKKKKKYLWSISLSLLLFSS